MEKTNASPLSSRRLILPAYQSTTFSPSPHWLRNSLGHGTNVESGEPRVLLDKHFSYLGLVSHTPRNCISMTFFMTILGLRMCCGRPSEGGGKFDRPNRTHLSPKWEKSTVKGPVTMAFLCRQCFALQHTMTRIVRNFRESRISQMLPMLTYSLHLQCLSFLAGTTSD
jgi:hypothetical protein